jgi:hypothetical protein
MFSEEIKERIVDVSQGNPGAVTAFMSVLPLFVATLSLPNQQDTYIGWFIDYLKEKGLTGPNLWIRFKDVNNRNAEEMLFGFMEDGLVDFIGRKESGQSEAA